VTMYLTVKCLCKSQATLFKSLSIYICRLAMVMLFYAISTVLKL